MSLLKNARMSGLIPVTIISTVSGFGGSLLLSTHVYLVEQAVCREHYMRYDSMKVGIDGLVDEELCKLPTIEARVASIYGIYCALLFLPSLFLAGPYGRIGTLLGKRTVLFMNLVSYVLAGIYFTSICYFYTTFDIRWIYLAPFFDIVGGGRVILISFLYSYVSECTSSKKLSDVLYKISALTIFLNFVALTISSFTLRRNVWLQCVLGITSLALLIPFALLLPGRRSSSSPLEEADEEAAISTLKVTLEPEITETTSLMSSSSSSYSVAPLPPPLPPPLPQITTSKIITTILSALCTHHTHTFSLVKRLLTSPPFIRITLLTYFVLTLSSRLTVILTQWASLTYAWVFADVVSLKSFEMLVSGLFLFSLPYVSRFLARREAWFQDMSEVDLFIVKASVGMSLVGTLCLGFAPSRSCYVISIAVSTLGSGVLEALRSFVTARFANFQKQDEGGQGEAKGGEGGLEELYLGIGLVETIAGILGSVFWSGLFARALGKGYLVERAPFMACAGVLVVVFICVVSLGRVGKDKRRGDEAEEAGNISPAGV